MIKTIFAIPLLCSLLAHSFNFSYGVVSLFPPYRFVSISNFILFVMKKNWLGITLLGLLFVFACGCTGGGSSDDSYNELGKYGIKSGIVEFAPIEIMGVTTKQTIYFEDYGNTELEENISVGNIFGLTSKTYSVSLVKDGYVYTYDILKLENGKDVTEKVLTKAKLVPDMLSAMQQFSISEDMKKNFDYREEGFEIVAGVKGIKYSICLNKDFPDSRITGVHYKNVVLKTQLGGVLVVASRFEENPPIPSSKFKLPAGYTVQELDINNLGNLQGDTIE